MFYALGHSFCALCQKRCIVFTLSGSLQYYLFSDTQMLEMLRNVYAGRLLWALAGLRDWRDAANIS